MCRSVGKNVIIFGFDDSYSVHIDGRNKNISVLGEKSTQGSDNATITVEGKYPIIFTESVQQLMLSHHYNGSNGFLFLNAIKIFQFKSNKSETKPYPLCSDINFTISNMRKNRIKSKCESIFC